MTNILIAWLGNWVNPNEWPDILSKKKKTQTNKNIYFWDFPELFIRISCLKKLLIIILCTIKYFLFDYFSWCNGVSLDQKHRFEGKTEGIILSDMERTSKTFSPLNLLWELRDVILPQNLFWHTTFSPPPFVLPYYYYYFLFLLNHHLLLNSTKISPCTSWVQYDHSHTRTIIQNTD